MAKLNLTDRNLKTLARSERTTFWDGSQRCFGVRVSPEGRKTFVVKYRAGRTQRTYSIGTYPEVSLADARRIAKAVLGRAALGEDPAAERAAPPESLRFSELAERYLELYSKREKRSWRNDVQILKHDLLPAWGKREILDITKADVLALLERVVRRGATIHANRVRALISRIFNWAIERDYLQHSPCQGVKRPSPERKRERVLTDEEIYQLWHALEGEPAIFARTFRLLLLTAQRSGEVRTMHWNDLTGDEWKIPSTVAKNKRAHVVPLTLQVRAQIGARPSAGGWVLPSPRLAGTPLHADSLKTVANRLSKLLGWKFTPHDLRRTASTNMGRLKVPRFIIERVLNHTDGSVTGKYDLYEYFTEKAEALATWATRIEAILASDHFSRPRVDELAFLERAPEPERPRAPLM